MTGRCESANGLLIGSEKVIHIFGTVITIFNQFKSNFNFHLISKHARQESGYDLQIYWAVKLYVFELCGCHCDDDDDDDVMHCFEWMSVMTVPNLQSVLEVVKNEMSTVVLQRRRRKKERFLGSALNKPKYFALSDLCRRRVTRQDGGVDGLRRIYREGKGREGKGRDARGWECVRFRETLCNMEIVEIVNGGTNERSVRNKQGGDGVCLTGGNADKR
ncbi:unnamed protein product [Acanthocheilonema viteae]|uniref:Uncharacterized protein n=1 Tax=Acanthocheilonema viteae TaxID=6277 RepID=A0A498RXE0_ACAVI|nr:unnamed protein product [Acanthocheilonema viteae]